MEPSEALTGSRSLTSIGTDVNIRVGSAMEKEVIYVGFGALSGVNSSPQARGPLMKRTALIACALLLVGCSAPATDGATSSASSTPPPESADTAPCRALIGDDGGLVSESARFLSDVSELDDATATEAAALAENLEGVGETSSEELRDLLTTMQQPFREMQRAYAAGQRFSLDPAGYKAAANEVIARCEPQV